MLFGAANIFLGLLLARSARAVLDPRGRYSLHRFPKYHYDKDTTRYCAWWLNNQGDWTCDRIKNELEVSLKNFHDWNPSISIDCKNLPREQSFCIAPARRPVSTTTQTVVVPTTILSTATVNRTLTATTTATFNRTLTATATATLNRTITTTATATVNRTVTAGGTPTVGPPTVGTSSLNRTLTSTASPTASPTRTLTTSSPTASLNRTLTTSLPTTSLSRTLMSSGTAPIGTATLNRTTTAPPPSGIPSTPSPPAPPAPTTTGAQTAGAAPVLIGNTLTLLLGGLVAVAAFFF